MHHNYRYCNNIIVFFFFLFFEETSQNVSSLGNRSFYYSMYFRIQGEENHIFMFSDMVLCFEMKTYSTAINIKYIWFKWLTRIHTLHWDCLCACFSLFCKHRWLDEVEVIATPPQHPGSLLIIRGAETQEQIDF